MTATITIAVSVSATSCARVRGTATARVMSVFVPFNGVGDDESELKGPVTLCRRLSATSMILRHDCTRPRTRTAAPRTAGSRSGWTESSRRRRRHRSDSNARGRTGHGGSRRRDSRAATWCAAGRRHSVLRRAAAGARDADRRPGAIPPGRLSARTVSDRRWPGRSWGRTIRARSTHCAHRSSPWRPTHRRLWISSWSHRLAAASRGRVTPSPAQGSGEIAVLSGVTLAEVAEVAVDSDGRFGFGRVPPGRYLVSLFPTPPGFGSLVVDVREADVTALEIKRPTVRTVSGRVVTSSGPIPDWAAGAGHGHELRADHHQCRRDVHRPGAGRTPSLRIRRHAGGLLDDVGAGRVAGGRRTV